MLSSNSTAAALSKTNPPPVLQVVLTNYLGLPVPTLYIPVISGEVANYATGTADSTGISQTGAPSSVTGYIGSASDGAKQFSSASGQFMRLPNYTLSSSPTLSNFTVAFWFQVNSGNTTNFRNLWCISNQQFPTSNAKFTFAIYYQTTGNLAVEYAQDNAGFVRVRKTTPVELNTWNHLAAVFRSDNTFDLYINNVSVGTPSGSGTPVWGWTSVSHFLAKSSYDADQLCNCTIDDFRFYNGIAFTEAQLTTLYNRSTLGLSIAN